MTAFRIEHVWEDYFRIMQGDTKIAIVFPADSEGRVAVYPHPDTYPDLAFTGLPTPLLPEWMTFGSLAEVADFLGIEQERAAA